ncbi:phage terminase small subunit-related protein [Bacillus sp. 179-C3.3 HS]
MIKLQNNTRKGVAVSDMARARNPNRDKAIQLWKESDGGRLLKDIAE